MNFLLVILGSLAVLGTGMHFIDRYHQKHNISTMMNGKRTAEPYCLRCGMPHGEQHECGRKTQ